jgi:hypothetical protein
MSLATVLDVPGSRRTTPLRTFVLANDLWGKLGRAAEEAGFRNRADLIRAVLLWWLREPGAKMPKRPDPPS